jgi:putative ABC transport system permease protein
MKKIKPQQIKEEIRLFCKNSLRVGFFLGIRQVRRANVWTNLLIIAVMVFTFLNVVVVNGILIGLVEGSSGPNRDHYSGDVLISSPEDKLFIKNSDNIVSSLERTEGVLAVSPRYIVPARVQTDYTKKIKASELPDQVSSLVVGIDPEKEELVTNLSSLLSEGSYLDEDDFSQILIDGSLLSQYSRGVPGEELLEGVEIGSKVRIFINNTFREFTVKGIIDTKVGGISGKIFINKNILIKLRDRSDNNAEEIAIKGNGISADELKESVILIGINQKDALIETWREAQGQFFEDLSKTFNTLGFLIGSIGIFVASITIFIVIFINALNRQKYIGILKGIGICGQSIELAYIFQAMFYALAGTIIGLLLVYGVIKPYFDINPIDFPFSDGILYIPIIATLIKVGLLFAVVLFAGYLPAKIIVRKNTLDAILDR